LDQYFYNLYWKSSFILVGTPAGVTLSPEGAQHGWKSDIQIPNQITWEPFFCQELDWIMCESMKRHLNHDNVGRNGVLIRGVTRGVEQKDMMLYLKRQARFKAEVPGELARSEYLLTGATDESTLSTVDEAQILETIRSEVLKGAYYLIDYRGYAGYEAGDNVINIFAMGSMGTEALKASEALLAKGVYANVIIVTSSDLLCGIQAHENNYQYLREYLGINANLHVHPKEQLNGHEFITVSGRRIPIVSVHDGEAGLLDNLGSVIGVRHESLAVRHHSKCGRPPEIYEYHGIDWQSVMEACGKVLAETALEEVKVSQTVLRDTEKTQDSTNWTDLWPTRPQNRH
jgi:pyruvate dehydrogenase E1 component